MYMYSHVFSIQTYSLIPKMKDFGATCFYDPSLKGPPRAYSNLIVCLSVIPPPLTHSEIFKVWEI